MQINALRRELTVLLSGVPLSRPAALRRSGHEEWLYATDLPALCDGKVKESLMQRLREAGWEYGEEPGWILLRKTAEEPPEGWYGGLFGPEAACCLSLLKRHVQDTGSDPEAVQRLLIKAGEEGEGFYEAACARLHRDWAARLRRKEPLPAVSRRYFGG